MDHASNPTVYVTRHGERIDFIDRNWAGSNDDVLNPPLSPNGLIQARDLGAHLRNKGVTRVFASPFLRTLQTGNAIAEALDVPMHIEDGASELLEPKWYPHDPRIWTRRSLASQFPTIDLSHESVLMPDYPEDWETLKQRAGLTMQRLVDKYITGFIVVAHGASMSGLTWGLVQGHPQTDNACCGLNTMVKQADDSWQLTTSSETSFLSYREPTIRYH